LLTLHYGCDSDPTPKINDRFEFPFEIDLDEFLDETADRSKPWMYKLHGVLVHSGDLHGGHYFALIKPDRETRWLKFDDDRVTPVTDREVLEENYGGEPLNGVVPQTQRNQVRAMKRFTNAYMLVYIRDTAVDEVLSPFTEEDTPPHLSKLMLRWWSKISGSPLPRTKIGRGTCSDGGKEEGERGAALVPDR
jgi:ubiquitin carboxyl-terminal hydrolase 7